MRWIYENQIQNTLTIPFYAVGGPQQFSVRLTTEEGETLKKAYLCLLSPDFVGYVRGRIAGTSKWYKVGSIFDTEMFIGTIGDWSFKDLEIQIDLPDTTESGPYRLPFVALHGDREHGPNRNFCAEETTRYYENIPAVNTLYEDSPADPIPDNTTTEWQIAVADIVGNIDRIEVALDITHPATGGLTLTLVSPDATECLLSDANGTGSDFTETILSDEAETTMQEGDSPFTGTFKPDEPLSVFSDTSPNGTWTLRIEDFIEGDIGTLNNWGVRIIVAGSGLIAQDYSRLGDDEFDTPLWSGSQGGCPGFETGSKCGVDVYGHAVPDESINAFQVVTTFLESGIKKMKRATTDTIQNATAVGMVIEEYVDLHETVGSAVAVSDDGRYFYEHGGQEVDANGNLLDVWHPEIRVLDTTTGIWRDLGTCGEAIQRDHTMILLDGKLYIFGGDDGGSIAGYTTYYKSLYVFDLETLTCTQLDDAPVERAGAGGIINDNEIHFIGGWNSSGPLSGVDWYDTVSGDWHVVALPPELEEYAPTIYPYVGYQSGWSRPIPDSGISIISTVCVDGRIYAWGLEESLAGDILVLKTFPTSSLGWSREAVTVPDGALGGKPIAYQGDVYFANPFALVDHHYVEPIPTQVYDTVEKTWTTITTSLPPALTLGTMYSFDGAAVVGDKIYYWGGEDTGNLLDRLRQTIILVFDIPTLTWDATVHYVGESIYGWKGDVIDGILYQLSNGGYQQSINLSTFTATQITAERDGSFSPIWGTAQDGKVYWNESWAPPV